MKNFIFFMTGLTVFFFTAAALFEILGLSQANPASSLADANYVQKSGLTYEQGQTALLLADGQEAIDTGSGSKLHGISDLLVGVAALILVLGIVLVVMIWISSATSTERMIDRWNGN